jgi:hypothetical protein
MAKIGIFTPTPDSAPLPGSGAQSAPRGPIPEGTKPFSPDDFDPSVIQPAKSVQDLQAQVARLIIVFQDAEGREPAPGDSEFWQAYNTLVQRFGETYETPNPTGQFPH